MVMGVPSGLYRVRESCLRKCSRRKSWVIVVAIIVSSLLFYTGTAHIQRPGGFIDGLTHPCQRLAAARTVDGKVVVGELPPVAAEPEVVGDHFLQPQTALRHDGVVVQRGEHGHFLCTLGVTVDEGIIADLGHGSHRPSIKIQKPALAIGQRFCLCAKTHGAEAVVYFPDARVLMLGNDHRLPLLSGKQHLALILAPGEAVFISVGQLGLRTVIESSFHKFPPV